MAKCLHCDTALAGRRRVCDDCKAKMPAPRRRRGKASSLAQDDVVSSEPVRSSSSPATEPGVQASAGEDHDAEVPPGLHPRGAQLWTELGQRQGTLAGELALEACRMVDRLNELDRIIAGKGVMQLLQFRLGLDLTFDDTRRVDVTVGFQAVMQEARLQQTAFKDVLKELRAVIAAAPPKTAPTPAPGTPATPATAPVLSPLDQLAARRAEREQATTGT